MDLGSLLTLNSLDEEINALDSSCPAAYTIEVGVDSGAAVSALTNSACADYPIETDARTGTAYVVASGEKVTDRGVRRYIAETGGQLVQAQGRVCGVHKNLAAVYDMVSAGHKVIFDIEKDADGTVRDHSHAIHKQTGTIVPFTLKGRVWSMKLNVIPFATAKPLLEAAKGSNNAVNTNSEANMARQLNPFQGPPPRV